MSIPGRRFRSKTVPKKKKMMMMVFVCLCVCPKYGYTHTNPVRFMHTLVRTQKKKEEKDALHARIAGALARVLAAIHLGATQPQHISLVVGRCCRVSSSSCVVDVVCLYILNVFNLFERVYLWTTVHTHFHPQPPRKRASSSAHRRVVIASTSQRARQFAPAYVFLYSTGPQNAAATATAAAAAFDDDHHQQQHNFK